MYSKIFCQSQNKITFDFFILPFCSIFSYLFNLKSNCSHKNIVFRVQQRPNINSKKTNQMNRMKIKHTKSTAYFKACYSYYKNVVHYIFTQSGQNENRKINNNLKNFWKIYFSTSKPISVEILFGFSLSLSISMLLTWS